jgi:hypothetical protein
MSANTIYAPTLDPRLKSFLPHFFEVSDDPNTAAEYPNLFTSDTKFQFTSLVVHGTEGSPTHPLSVTGCLLRSECCWNVLMTGIKKLREIMWEGNTPRWHEVKRVFGEGLEIMMYGTVTQQLPKEEVVLDFASHMILEDVLNGEVKVKDYQVWAVLRRFPTRLTVG